MAADGQIVQLDRAAHAMGLRFFRFIRVRKDVVVAPTDLVPITFFFHRSPVPGTVHQESGLTAGQQFESLRGVRGEGTGPKGAHFHELGQLFRSLEIGFIVAVLPPSRRSRLLAF